MFHLTSQQHRRSAVVGAAVALALVVTGCGKAAENLSEKATEKIIESQGEGNVDVDIDNDDGSYSINTDEGSISFGADLPRSWPEDVPLPDDLAVTGGSDMSSDGGALVVVSGLTSMAADDVLNMYESSMSGWTEQSKQEINGEQRIVSVSYVNGERMLSVGTSEGTGETTLTLSYTESPS